LGHRTRAHEQRAARRPVGVAAYRPSRPRTAPRRGSVHQGSQDRHSAVAVGAFATESSMNEKRKKKPTRPKSIDEVFADFSRKRAVRPILLHPSTRVF